MRKQTTRYYESGVLLFEKPHVFYDSVINYKHYLLYDNKKYEKIEAKMYKVYRICFILKFVCALTLVKGVAIVILHSWSKLLASLF